MTTQRNISVYSGTDLVGRVVGADKDWRALDARGNPLLGEFKTWKAAYAAVNSSIVSVPCVADANARLDNS